MQFGRVFSSGLKAFPAGSALLNARRGRLQAQSAKHGVHTMARRVPVTIVTGALGAGKTTLLKHILTQHHGKRIAVIENEFAESLASSGGIESLVLKDGVDGSVAEGFYELANGCICCNVRDGLVQTLTVLMEKRDRFDYILVETSGMADPGPVASIFWSDEDDLGSALVLDGIVTLVDARHVHGDLDRPREAGAVNETVRQIAHADVVLVNKTDLVPDAAALARVERRISLINAGAAVHRSTMSSLPLDRILDLRAYDPQQSPALLGAGDDVCEGHNHSHSAGHSHGDDHGHCDVAHDHEHSDCGTAHKHDSRVGSVVLATTSPVDLAAFRTWIGEILWDNRVPGANGPGASGVAGHDGSLPAPALAPSEGDDDDAPPDLAAPEEATEIQSGPATRIFRGKGILFVALEDSSEATGSPQIVPHIFQSVHALFDVNPARGASADALSTPQAQAEGSRVLLIGENLHPQQMQESFNRLVVRR